jgi:hypothetical protein
MCICAVNSGLPVTQGLGIQSRATDQPPGGHSGLPAASSQQRLSKLPVTRQFLLEVHPCGWENSAPVDVGPPRREEREAEVVHPDGHILRDRQAGCEAGNKADPPVPLCYLQSSM